MRAQALIRDGVVKEVTILSGPRVFHAAVLYDNALAVKDGYACDDPTGPGVSCGATVEVWASKADANARAKYIQTLEKAASMLGGEYDYISNGVLLRIDGKIKPSEAKKYNAAFGGATTRPAAKAPSTTRCWTIATPKA